MLERRSDILFYQPTPYTLIHPRREFRYTPSVCAYAEDLGLVFFEISRFRSDENEDELVRHEDWFGEMGYQFHAFNPCEHITYCELLQWRFLYSYSLSFEDSGISVALDVLRDHQARSVQELLNAGAEFSDIAFQLFYAKASADLRLPITRTTQITLPGKK